MMTKIKIGEKSYNIDISEIKDDLLKVKVDDKNYFFAKNEFGEIVPVDSQAQDSNLLAKENEILWEVLAEKKIKSPIAGTISAIYVKEKQEVRPGQKVATLIAMKMENEIIAESYGKIKEIKVKENQSVNTSEVLIILE